MVELEGREAGKAEMEEGGQKGRKGEKRLRALQLYEGKNIKTIFTISC